MDDRGEVFQGENEEWFWRIVAGNNEVIADGEGFTRQEDAVRAGARVRPDVAWSTVEKD